MCNNIALAERLKSMLKLSLNSINIDQLKGQQDEGEGFTYSHSIPAQQTDINADAALMSRSPKRSLTLRKARGALEWREPFHSMIGIYLGFWP
jgi:hypothetical protein